SACQPPHPTPVLVRLPRGSGRVARATAGYQDVLVLTSKGQLYGFGNNAVGGLGVPTNSGTDTPNPRPMRVTLPGASGRITDVIATIENTLALTSTGQVYAFGSNEYGQLGYSADSTPNPTPRRVKFP